METTNVHDLRTVTYEGRHYSRSIFQTTKDETGRTVVPNEDILYSFYIEIETRVVFLFFFG